MEKLNEHGYTEAQTAQYKATRNRTSKNYHALANTQYHLQESTLILKAF